jgi:hypothetical protein
MRMLHLAIACCFLALALPPARAAAQTKNVLLVCQYGSVKSAIARELLRRRAAERGIQLAVQSRGLTPEAHMSPLLQSQVEADGLEPAADPLRALATDDLQKADLVVYFDRPPQGFPQAPYRDWTSVGSLNADYARSKADILRRIDALLDEIAGGQSP